MFEIGEIVQCCRAVHPGHEKLVGSIGEIYAFIDPLFQLFYRAHYVVTFPGYPSGKCPYCPEDHNPLYFFMHAIEIKRIDDPDAALESPRIEETPLEEEHA